MTTPSIPTVQLHVFCHDELYEVTIKGTFIKKLVRFVGTNQRELPITWDELTEEVKLKILDSVRDHLES